MANIEVHKGDKEKPTPTTVEPRREPPRWEPLRWEPLRVMRDLLGWDPFREIAPSIPQLPVEFVPSFDIKETKDAYIFKADVPGVKESDLEVTVTGNRLKVSGKREAEKEEKTDTYYSCERSYGEFTRSFTLPDGVDMNSLQANLADGVLTLSVKKTPEAQAKKVDVQTAAKKS